MTLRRGKRVKQDAWTSSMATSSSSSWNGTGTVKRPKPSCSTTTTISTKRQIPVKRNRNETPSGGMVVLLPSLIGIVILICSVMAKYGFRGRASVCGIDLGTTNSVICVQEQGGGVTSTSTTNATNNNLMIHCIADPSTGSPVVPSVVSFLDASDRQRLMSSKSANSSSNSILDILYSIFIDNGSNNKVTHQLQPDPSHVIVGQEAKRRIDSHPHHTLYHAKRVLGRPTTDPAIATLRNEVEFGVYDRSSDTGNNHDNHNEEDGVEFRVPDTPIPITPGMVGSYIVHHLLQMTYTVLGHTNVKSAIICVPAKFNEQQRYETIMAFRNAGITVARIVEEPTAAALAYGLHRKAGVDYILVYDFGGGTLDISLLHVSDGYVDVMGSDGDDRLGGSDFDDVIAKYLLQDRNGSTIVQTTNVILHDIQESIQPPVDDLEDILSHQCPALRDIPLCTVSSYHTLGEQLKISLSEKYTSDSEEISVAAQCLGISDKKKYHDTDTWTIERFCSDLELVPLTLSSSEFRTISQPLLNKSILPVQRLLQDLNIQSNDIQEIVMVGGTTRMPQIRQLVQSTFPNSQMNIRIDPDLTVAYGAASVID